MEVKRKVGIVTEGDRSGFSFSLFLAFSGKAAGN
jgi:hypothetical protein